MENNLKDEILNNQSIEESLPASLEDLKKRRAKLLKELAKSKTKTKPLDKLVVWITKRVGSMGFFVIIFLWTIIWLGWNMLGPKPLRYDPYPAFVLWLFISNYDSIVFNASNNDW
jgi:uncharacterized membrane protein